MSYGGYLIRHPLFWSALAGVGLGAALAAATWRTRRSRHPSRAASRKWALTWLALSLAVGSAAAGVIVPAGLIILAPPSLLTLGIATLVVTAGLRFPRAVGVPLLVLIGTASVFSATITSGFEPVREPVELARITVLALRDDEISLEVVRSGREQTAAPDPDALVGDVVTVPGIVLEAQALALDLNDAFFLLGAPRFASYTGPGASPPPERSPLAGVLERWGLVRVGTLEARQGVLNLLREYSFVVGPEGGALFVPIRR
ncbi:MAG: hypothetical protein ACOC1U_04125 [Spirochaetota bacterium]